MPRHYDPAKEAYEAAIHDYWVARQPSLVQSIIDTMNLGESPAQIEATLKQRRVNPFMRAQVRSIAVHLARTTT